MSSDKSKQGRDWTRETRETIVIAQFVEGLGQKNLQRHVQFRHSKTLSEAIVLASEFVSFAVTSTDSLEGLDPGQDGIPLCQRDNELQSSN